MDHAVILVCTYIKAVANSVILQLYFDMIILKILKSNIYYIASRSAPPHLQSEKFWVLTCNRACGNR